MKKQIEINKDWGFWGTVTNYAETEQQVQDIWDATLARLGELYPQKKDNEIIEFLNSRSGRHFADSLLDNKSGFHLGLTMMKIALLNKIKMLPWWNHYNDVPTIQSTKTNEILLYKSALRGVMNIPKIDALMRDMTGCNVRTPFWEHPEQWVNSVNTTIQELKNMWSIIQKELENADN